MTGTEKKQIINDLITQNGDWTMFADGFDDAILGIDYSSQRVIYSIKKCYEILMNGDNKMTEDEAEEYFAFNVLGSFVGEKTPIYCYDLFERF